jgi:prepilin-type N-terminal cleavage/methylation domain-containing protein
MNRAGFTLTELLLTVVLLLIVVEAVAAIVQRQQRFYAAVSAIVDQRNQLRDALGLLPSDLRGASSVGGDFIALADSAVDLRATIGSGVVCDTAAGRGAVFLPPPLLASGIRLTVVSTTPRDGDEMFAYDEGSSIGVADDDWQRLTVLQTDSVVVGPCPGAPFADPVRDAGSRRIRVTFRAGDTLRTTIRLGAPVRFTRRVRYSLYRSGSEWHLGFRDWNRNVFNGIQPLSGPYTARSGITFRYTDSLGAPATTSASVARVDIGAHARTSGPLRAEGFRRGVYADSLSIAVAVRNRR